MDDVYKIASLNCLQYFIHCEYYMNCYTALFREIQEKYCVLVQFTQWSHSNDCTQRRPNRSNAQAVGAGQGLMVYSLAGS